MRKIYLMIMIGLLLSGLLSGPGVIQAQGADQPAAEQIRGLAQMYVEDERFAAQYGGAEAAAYVRDALLAATD